MVALIFLIYRFRRSLQQWRSEKTVRYILAFALIICEMSYFWRLIAIPSLQPNPVDHLPITVCGWTVIFCSYMLVGKSQTLFDISYFWLFSGTVFALITPTVITYTGPTRFRYYQFWLEHTLGYVAVFYMIFVHGMRPAVKSAIKSYCALVVWRQLPIGQTASSARAPTICLWQSLKIRLPFWIYYLPTTFSV